MNTEQILNALENVQNNIKLSKHILDLTPEIKGLTDMDNVNINAMIQAITTVGRTSDTNIQTLTKVINTLLEEG